MFAENCDFCQDFARKHQRFRLYTIKMWKEKWETRIILKNKKRIFIGNVRLMLKCKQSDDCSVQTDNVVWINLAPVKNPWKIKTIFEKMMIKEGGAVVCSMVQNCSRYTKAVPSLLYVIRTVQTIFRSNLILLLF